MTQIEPIPESVQLSFQKLAYQVVANAVGRGFSNISGVRRNPHNGEVQFMMVSRSTTIQGAEALRINGFNAKSDPKMHLIWVSPPAPQITVDPAPGGVQVRSIKLPDGSVHVLETSNPSKPATTMLANQTAKLMQDAMNGDWRAQTALREAQDTGKLEVMAKALASSSWVSVQEAMDALAQAASVTTEAVQATSIAFDRPLEDADRQDVLKVIAMDIQSYILIDSKEAIQQAQWWLKKVTELAAGQISTLLGERDG